MHIEIVISVDYEAKKFCSFFPFFASKFAKMKMITKSDNPSGHSSALIFAFIASKGIKCFSTHTISQTCPPVTYGCVLGSNLSLVVKNMTIWKRFKGLSDLYLLACLEAWPWAWWRGGSTKCISPLVFRKVKLKNIYYEKIVMFWIHRDTTSFRVLLEDPS